jgi:recombinational DNA repair ATPase RecF
MPKIYRSARGKVIDIDKLRLFNEEIVAAGNQLVNARGDRINHLGQVIESRNESMNKVYKKKLNAPADELVFDTVDQAKSNGVEPDLVDSQKLQNIIEKLQGESVREAEKEKVIVTQDPGSKPLRGGLASAIQKDLDYKVKKSGSGPRRI